MKYYTMNGAKDILGNIIPGTNLVELMDSCQDFLTEVILLQEIIGRLGVIVHRSPKCHADLAGEGIEYSWGFANNFYRRLPICEKRTKDKFKASMSKVLSTEYLKKERVRRFARRALGYLCAYYRLQYTEDGDAPQGETISPQQIERLVKDFKTHRYALDFEFKFIVESEEGEELPGFFRVLCNPLNLRPHRFIWSRRHFRRRADIVKSHLFVFLCHCFIN